MNIDQKAQAGVGLLKEAIVGYLEINKHGCGNSEIAKSLNIESDFEGNQKNYLSGPSWGCSSTKAQSSTKSSTTADGTSLSIRKTDRAQSPVRAQGTIRGRRLGRRAHGEAVWRRGFA